MSRISTYPIDSVVNVDDLLIGTDSEDSNITKNYSIESIVDLMVGGYINAVDILGATTAIADTVTVVPMEADLVVGLSSLWSVGAGSADNTIVYGGSSVGVFSIVSSIVSTGTQGDVIEFYLNKNGVPIAGTMQETENYPTGSATVMAIVSLSPGDSVGISLRNITAVRDVTCKQVSIVATAV